MRSLMHGRVSILIAYALSALIMSGCTSISRGVTQAIFNPDSDDYRQCLIEGESFKGIDEITRAAGFHGNIQTTRLLVVHGIGEHKDNYSKPFVDNLTQAMGLTYRSASQKRIQMTKAIRVASRVYDYPPGKLGPLLVTRYTDRNKTRELLVFEVNWSDYNSAERKTLIDNDTNPKGYQAAINAQVKSFFNKQVVDPIRYIGASPDKIRSYVREASCWLVALEWDEYRSSNRSAKDGDNRQYEPQICPIIKEGVTAIEKAREIVERDSFIAVTHSLGSRIFLDAFSIPDAMLMIPKIPLFPCGRSSVTSGQR